MLICFYLLNREHNLGSVGLCVINSIRRNYPPHDGAHIALSKYFAYVNTNYYLFCSYANLMLKWLFRIHFKH